MHTTLEQSYIPTATRSGVSPRTVKVVGSKPLPISWAVALYFAGALVETLGLGLIAAYGWLLAGGAIAICGLAVGAFGNRRWAVAPVGESSVMLLKSYVHARRARVDDLTATMRIGRV